jgi:hypothetical protein
MRKRRQCYQMGSVWKTLSRRLWVLASCMERIQARCRNVMRVIAKFIKGEEKALQKAVVPTIWDRMG